MDIFKHINVTYSVRSLREKTNTNVLNIIWYYYNRYGSTDLSYSCLAWKINEYNDNNNMANNIKSKKVFPPKSYLLSTKKKGIGKIS